MMTWEDRMTELAELQTEYEEYDRFGVLKGMLSGLVILGGIFGVAYLFWRAV